MSIMIDVFNTNDVLKDKLKSLDILFTYLANNGNILLTHTPFNKMVIKKLYSLYHDECVTECINWYKCIYGEDIHTNKYCTS